MYIFLLMKSKWFPFSYPKLNPLHLHPFLFLLSDSDTVVLTNYLACWSLLILACKNWWMNFKEIWKLVDINLVGGKLANVGIFSSCKSPNAIKYILFFLTFREMNVKHLSAHHGYLYLPIKFYSNYFKNVALPI